MCYSYTRARGAASSEPRENNTTPHTHTNNSLFAYPFVIGESQPKDFVDFVHFIVLRNRVGLLEVGE